LKVADGALPVEGGCRCGQVRFRVSAPPLVTAACHCAGCQKMASSAFSLTATVPTDGFAVIRGEPVLGGLHGQTRHYFCGYCMSWMFTQADAIAGLTNIRTPLLDDGRWTEPFIETFTSEKLAWATTPAVHSYATFPSVGEYGGLMAAYKAHIAGSSQS
jgi:hypothetical protein